MGETETEFKNVEVLTEDGLKKRKYSLRSCTLGENALLISVVRGQKRMSQHLRAERKSAIQKGISEHTLNLQAVYLQQLKTTLSATPVIQSCPSSS